MHFSSLLFTVLLLTLATNLYALNTTNTTTTKVPIVTCTKQSQCLNSQYCNIKQRVCMLKHAINSSCSSDIECNGNKCHDYICRRPCSSEKQCSLTKEYCSFGKYCEPKYCGVCFRDAQCADNQCSFLHCTSDVCKKALENLRKQP